MRINLKILALLFAVALILQLSTISAKAGHSLSLYQQEVTPRPTLPNPTSGGGNPGNPPTNTPRFVTDTPKPATPTVTPTPTQTMDLSLHNFLTKTLVTGNHPNTVTPFIDHTPMQNTITATFAVTYSGSLQTITPVSGTNGTVINGVIIPLVIIVIILIGIFSIRRFLWKR
jgi:hypothetical protein